MPKPFAILGKLLGRKQVEKHEPFVGERPKRKNPSYRLAMNPSEEGFETRDQRYRLVDPIKPPFPLPHVSRASLRRIQDPLPAPVSCPYCGGEVALDSNDVIYRGKRYGDWPYVYHCNNGCDAYVGLHPNTDIPLGYLADRDTRASRKEAKEVFFEWLNNTGRRSRRTEAYSILAERMGIPVSECHFAMFDIASCERAIAHVGNLMAEELQSHPAFDKDLPWD